MQLDSDGEVPSFVIPDDLDPGTTLGGDYVYRAGGIVIPVADGGTGKASWTPYAIPFASSSAALNQIPVGQPGQLLTVNPSATGYVWSTPRANVGYPGAGLAVSTGAAWANSYTDSTKAIVFMNTSSTPSGIPMGEPSQVLRVNSSKTGYSWDYDYTRVFRAWIAGYYLSTADVTDTVITNSGQQANCACYLPVPVEGMRFSIILTDLPTAGPWYILAWDQGTIIWADAHGTTKTISSFHVDATATDVIGAQVDCVALQTGSGLKWFCRRVDGPWVTEQ